MQTVTLEACPPPQQHNGLCHPISINEEWRDSKDTRYYLPNRIRLHVLLSLHGLKLAAVRVSSHDGGVVCVLLCDVCDSLSHWRMGNDR